MKWEITPTKAKKIKTYAPQENIIQYDNFYHFHMLNGSDAIRIEINQVINIKEGRRKGIESTKTKIYSLSNKTKYFYFAIFSQLQWQK